MYRVMIGYLFVLFDVVFKLTDAGNKADLFPDFIGFLLIFWGMWGFRKESERWKQLVVGIGVAFVYTYAAYVLDMFGVLSKIPELAILAVSVGSDLLKMISIYLFTNVIKDMEKKRGNLQSTKMIMIWRIMFICYFAQYLFISMQQAEIAFFLFSKLAVFTFLFYIFTTGNLISLQKRNMTAASDKNISKYAGNFKHTKNGGKQ